jgi:hypothetical protein
MPLASRSAHGRETQVLRDLVRGWEVRPRTVAFERPPLSHRQSEAQLRPNTFQ